MCVMQVSPYHAQNIVDNSSGAQYMWKMLPTQYLPDQNRASVSMAQVCESLELIAENRAKRETQVAIIQNLFKQAFDQPNNTIEIFLLLKILMPQQDINNVYGMKTKRLFKLVVDTIKNKYKLPEYAISLQNWLINPTCERSDWGIVSRPEHQIVSVFRAMKINHPQLFPREQRVTVQDIGIMCSSLTRCYLTEKDHLMDVKQKEIIYAASQYLGTKEFELFLKLILKKVPIGVGPKTVLQSFPNIDAVGIFEKQHDVGQIANQCTRSALDPPQVWQSQTIRLLCGTPFTPMTCKVLKSPYLFKWIFSSEEKLKKPITPVDGRLIIAEAKWYIPMKYNTKQKTYFNIDGHDMIKNQSRKAHVKLLRQFKQQNLIQEQVCEGLVLHYTLSLENKHQTVLLIRMLSNALLQDIELYDQLTSGEMVRNDNIIASSFSANLDSEEDIERKIDQIITKKPDSNEEDAPADKFIVRNVFHTTKKKKHANLLKTKKGKKSTTKPKEVTEQEEKVIVQVKYDGDRIQVHVARAPDDKLQVRLFTKSGRDVSALYSSVRDELQLCQDMWKNTPCILDGELLVVDKDAKPLPWNNEKWKYNNPSTEGTIVRIENTDKDDINSSSITFVYGDKVTEEAAEPTKSVPQSECRLMVIVYDILMDKGTEVYQRPCIERLQKLKQDYEACLLGTQHFRVIQASFEINQTSRLLDLLKDSIQNEHEGLILKDPNSEYEFKQSSVVQKLKLKGPDINTYVVGAGFSFSSNPHQWGFLSCIKIDDSPQFIGYVRTEFFEGSQPWRGLEVFKNLKSVRLVSDALPPNSDTLRLSMGEGTAAACTVVLSKSNLVDIQWLCNPLECPFGLSLRGDLWPIHSDLAIPRNPVGRIELSGFQMSQCDSIKSVKTKYEEAQSTHLWLESALLRNALSSLRKKYPSNDSDLQLLRKVMLGFLSFKTKEEKWPQSPPRLGYSLNEFNTLISECMNKCEMSEKIKPYFNLLSMEEKLVLGQIPTQNEWSMFDKQKVKRIPTIEEEEEEQEALINIQKLRERLCALSDNVKKPLVPRETSSEFVREGVLIDDMANIHTCCIYPPPFEYTEDEA